MHITTLGTWKLLVGPI